MTHAETYFAETCEIALLTDTPEIERIAGCLNDLRYRSGRLFIIGLGGSAANASHAASDFVNLCAINATCLSDNIAEFTASANDCGWDESYRSMLQKRCAGFTDALMVLSVGGGTDNVSLPLTKAIGWAKEVNMAVIGIVGRDGGYTKANADYCVVVPTVSQKRVTPHTEGMTMVVLHALVSHPLLQRSKTTW